MSTSYDLYISAPEFNDAEAVTQVLKARGATNEAQIDGSEWPDRWQVDWPGLGVIDILNERLHPVGTVWEDEPMFGYDFCLSVSVEFRDDNEVTRGRVLNLAAEIGHLFATVVVYNFEHILIAYVDGQLARPLDESCGFVGATIKQSPAMQLLMGEGVDPVQLGLPDD